MKKLSVLIVLMLVNVLIAQNPANQIQQMEKALKQNPNNFEMQLNLGKLQYQQVMQGEKTLLKPAVQHLKKAVKLLPESSIAHCWYGSSIVMKAKYAIFPPTKSYYVIAGMKEMDKAIALDGENITSHVIRGQTCLGIPSFFGRNKTAIEDFTVLEKMTVDSPDEFEDGDRPQILYYLGSAYKKDGNTEQANAIFSKLKNEFPKSDYAAKVE